MKRSEMVSKIQELIELNLIILSQIPDASLLASTILEMQTQEGMLPPLGKEIEVPQLSRGLAVDDIYMTKKSHVWDTE